MNFEKYQPSLEEIKKAEEMMTDEQKKLSGAREEGYNIAKSEQDAEKSREKNPAEPTIEKYPGGSYKILAPEKPYREATTVNGVEISIHWDNGYGDLVSFLEICRMILKIRNNICLSEFSPSFASRRSKLCFTTGVRTNSRIRQRMRLFALRRINRRFYFRNPCPSVAPMIRSERRRVGGSPPPLKLRRTQ